MAGVGGYQRPSKPAAVSGPGAASQRTDGGPGETMTQAARYISGMPYGEGQQINGLAQAAPLAAAPDAPTAAPIAVTPIHAPTERPDEPLTAGSPFGPGPGPEVLPEMPAPQPEVDVAAAAIRAAYIRYPSPYLRGLVQQLEQEGR